MALKPTPVGEGSGYDPDELVAPGVYYATLQQIEVAANQFYSEQEAEKARREGRRYRTPTHHLVCQFDIERSADSEDEDPEYFRGRRMWHREFPEIAMWSKGPSPGLVLVNLLLQAKGLPDLDLDDPDGVDEDELAGARVKLVVEHYEAKQGKYAGQMRAKVSSVAPARASRRRPALVGAAIAAVNHHDDDVPEGGFDY